MDVLLAPADRTELLEVGDEELARVQGGQPRVALAGGGAHQAVLADDADLLEPVTAADLEVVGVVPRRDLQRACAEVGLDVLVGDDRKAAADERQHDLLADEMRVALVVGVHRNGAVGEHRLWPHGRDDDLTVAGGERIGDRVQHVDDPLALLDLEVGDRRAQAGIPIDHVVVAVDQALLVEIDEDLQHRLHVLWVQREALVLVVAGRAEALELLDDLAAVLLAPFPDASGELLAAELGARRALGLEQLLDLALGGDAGVVGAEDPLRAPSAHAVGTHQDILDRAVEGVAHVQRAGDVRRRDRDREVLLGAAAGLGMDEPVLEPALEDPRLHLRRLKSCAFLQIPHRLTNQSMERR